MMWLISPFTEWFRVLLSTLKVNQDPSCGLPGKIILAVPVKLVQKQKVFKGKHVAVIRTCKVLTHRTEQNSLTIP